VDAKLQNFVRGQRRQLAPQRGSIFCLLTLVGLSAAQAQLSITEVMSSASTNLGASLVVPKSDFWELTNFGTNTLSLEGYSFIDRDSDPSVRVTEPFRNCSIGPGESIIFLRRDTATTYQDFTNWWGAGNLPSALQVRPYPRNPGFDSAVDAVQLFDPNGDLVDRVDFGRALRGHTFVYDAQTGEFGSFSVLGVNGSFKAVLTDDVGSPGVTTGPIPLSILQQPVSVTQDAGSDVEFLVRAAGLPRPAYQWFFNEAIIPGARNSSLIIANVQPEHAGNYSVRIDNGLDSLVSAAAMLAVSTDPSPAAILIAPSDATIFEGQTAVFFVKARGYPPPVFQWQTNGVNIPGAINSVLVVPLAGLELSGTIYSVQVQNAYGSTNASARLVVTKPPKLAITEVMASVSGGVTSGHTDWFELTNLDTNGVSLLGYRFSDRYSFDLSFTITNSLVIEPGESVIFVERLSPEQFMDWWGGDRLPVALKIITYRGLGLSSEGDVINFWNSAETDPYSPVSSAGFLQSLAGLSQRFVPPDYYFVEDSVLGLDGAIRAVNGGDIGSPGYLANPPPRFLSMTRNQEAVVMKCRVTQGRQYALQSKMHLEDLYWTTEAIYSADDFVITIGHSPDSDDRFFRLEEMP
jgi:hypothetical protein